MPEEGPAPGCLGRGTMAAGGLMDPAIAAECLGRVQVPGLAPEALCRSHSPAAALG